MNKKTTIRALAFALSFEIFLTAMASIPPDFFRTWVLLNAVCGGLSGMIASALWLGSQESLTRHEYYEYRGDPMNMIIGPGSKNQMSRGYVIYCERCGLQYHHQPKG